MRAEEIARIRRRCLTRRTKFYYFKDRYALMLLSRAVANDPLGRSVSDLKKGPYARLLDKPVVRAVLARAPNGRVTSRMFDSVWPEQPECYLLTLGQWGDSQGWRWQQTSRRGSNLVLQLNFSEKHNRPYRKLVAGIHEHPFRNDFHPVAPLPRLTLAWARLDLDLERREAVIEEIQNDWLRSVSDELKWVRSRSEPAASERLRWRYGEKAYTARQLNDYAKWHLAPHFRLWDEAVLAASLLFLRRVLGIEKIFMHTFQHGNRLKRTMKRQPPRSVYADLPRRFCFDTSHVQPQIVAECRTAKVQRLIRHSPPQWFLINGRT